MGVEKKKPVVPLSAYEAKVLDYKERLEWKKTISPLKALNRVFETLRRKRDR